MDPEIQRSLCSIEELGRTLRDEAVRERVELATKPISENIPRPGIYTFCNRPPADLEKGPSKISTAKANLSLVTKMFMNLQSQPGADIDDFFRQESSRDPPSIASKGKLYTGNKSDLMDCIPGIPKPSRNLSSNAATVKLFDMAAVIHMINPAKAMVFGEFADLHLIPFLQSHITDVTTRIDGVWETYKNDSIKTQTRRMRGETASRRTRVSANAPIPKGKKYQKFLSDTNNKDELFQFLAEELTNKMRSSSCMFVTTKREFVLSNKDIDTDSLSPCDHEEGDTKIFLHLKHAVIEGHKKAFIRTVDTDIIVVVISVFHRLQVFGLEELWVGFGTGRQGYPNSSSMPRTRS